MPLRSLLTLFCFVASAVVCAAPTFAQQTPFSPPQTAPSTPPPAAASALADVPEIPVVISREGLETLKARIEAATDLSDAERSSALDLTQRALTSLTTAIDYVARNQADQELVKKVAEDRAALQQSVEAKQGQTAQRPEPNTDLVKLEQDLAVKKSEQTQAQTKLAAKEAEIQARAERQRAIKDRLAALPADKQAVQDQLDLIPKESDLDLPNEAKRAALLAEMQRLEAEPTRLQNELALISAREAAGILQLQRQELALEVERLKQEVQLYTVAVNRERRTNANNRRDDTSKAITAADASDLAWQQKLVPVYEETVRIIDDELDVQPRLEAMQVAVTRVERERESLDEELVQLQQREGRTGTSRAFGIRLRQQRELLPDPGWLLRQIHQRLQTYEDAQLHYFDLREQRKDLDDIDDNIEVLLRDVIGYQDSGEDELQPIRQEYRKAFEQQRESLDLVINAYDKYIEQLDSLDAEQERLAELSERFTDYIDERVLWIRSHEPFTLKSLTNDFESLKIFTDRAKWSSILSVLRIDFWGHLFYYSMFVVAWVFLLATQARQGRRIQQTSKKASSRLNVSMKPTLQGLLMTFSKSVILPLPILFLGWRLGAGTTELGQVDDVTQNLITLAWNLVLAGFGLFWLEFIRNVHRPQGLAQSHFAWSEITCQVVAKQVKSFIFMATPLIIIIAVLNAWNVDDDSETLARVFSVAVYLLLASTLHRLAERRSGALSAWATQSKNGWVDRFVIVFHLLAVLVPVAMAVLTSIGFTYPTDHLAVKLAQTIVMLFGVLFVRAILLRSLTLRQRRLAIEQARQARAAAQTESAKDAAPKSTVPEIQDHKAKLVEVSTQTRRLLNTTIFVLSLMGLWLIWTDVFPALHYFDEWALPGLGIRLPNLVTAIIAGILTATAARNIPGLLEITILEWLPLEKSMRYAIGAIVQYTIAILGLLAVSSQLSITWEKVQWLAAALTFGLGFGLQEIFANFVSGIIILFEQPVRVGDVVTIEGVTGVVNRIRIRSTTITDWDRKEYIVPNREFITGRLLNWTLTDTTNRIVVEVGVAYGTDPEAVHQLILKVAQSHPYVLREPPPVVTFEGFGDSSLKFVLRAYLPGLEQRLHTIHDLHIAINLALKEAGIEIPFPQRDLHIRSAVDLPLTANSDSVFANLGRSSEFGNGNGMDRSLPVEVDGQTDE